MTAVAEPLGLSVGRHGPWRRGVALAGLLALAVLPSAFEQGTLRRAADLPPAAQAAVSRVLGRDDHSYRAVSTAAGFKIANTKQGLTARFEAGSVQVRSGVDRLGLSLRSYGYGERLGPVLPAVPRSTSNRISYNRGPLSEWYVNGPLGLEQGFTLRTPPGDRRGGPLTLAIDLSGNLSASVEPDAMGLRFARSSLRYTGLTASDATGRQLDARLELRGSTLLLRVDDAGARYPLEIDPFVQQAKLTASDGANDDYLGYSIAIAGDTIVVGTFSTANQAVYVFVKPAGGWASATETAKLTASDAAASDYFGAAVAISGDTVAAGAFGQSSNAGAAYVFVKPPGGWADATETAKLTASDAAGGDGLGLSVAIAGETIVAGAGGFAGAAYVFAKPGGGWVDTTETAKLTASDGVTGDGLGYSVGIAGDTIVAGAPFDDSNRGSAYVFVKPGAGWADATQTAKLTASDAAAGDLLFAVAISGDTVVAGAGGDESGAGAAYVFVKPGGGWADGAQTAKLTASDGAGGDNFGVSVAISGDTLVAGAPGDDSAMGAAYFFAKPGGGWANATETGKLTGSDVVAGDGFGSSVGISGGVIAVSAPYQNSFAGAAYVFGSPSGPPVLGISKTQQDCTPSCGSATSSPISVDFHDTIRYEVTVSNTGGSAAPNVVVGDAPPLGFSVSDMLAPAGTACQTFKRRGSQTPQRGVLCTITTIPAGGSVVISIVATVDLIPSPCTIVGTSGNDAITVSTPPGASSHAEVICGLGGSDTITGGGAGDTIYGDTPSAFATPGPQVNLAWIDSNGDTLVSAGEPQASVSATILTGSGAGDTIHGAVGNYTIYGQEGADTVNGDDGNDTLFGNEGDDIVHGDAGADTVSGALGLDQLYGDADADTVAGNEGNDRIAGGDGPDTLNGNEDNDLVLGDAGNDSVQGATGVDRLNGGSGNDQVDGGGPNVKGGPPPLHRINNILVGGTGTGDTCSYGPITTLATRTDRGDIRDGSCESPAPGKSQKTCWNGSAYTFSPYSITASLFDWASFDGAEPTCP
jgi:uncharacterized repeat protein (TIGR01451 family)